MGITNDRKGAIKKLKLLSYQPKQTVDSFRRTLEAEFKTIFLPNRVECHEVKHATVTCDILSPEIYASNRVLIYIHGGCFVAGSRASYRSFCSSLASKAFSRVIVPEFRLSPAYPCPAAIEDIQTVFRAVYTEEQVACSLNAEEGKTKTPEIIIAADGSGASLACALILNLRDRYRSCIKHLILFSPWLDVSPTSRILTAKKANDEILNADVIRQSASDYTYAANTSSPSVSPLLATDEQLQNFPPTFIQMGEKEILLDDAKAFTKRLIANGNKCTLDIWPDMMFMFQMADEYLHESHLAMDKVGTVITEYFAGLEKIQIENQPKLEHSLHSEA